MKTEIFLNHRIYILNKELPYEKYRWRFETMAEEKGGNSTGMGILGLGLLIIIGILVIKFVRIDAFDPFLGIENPEGTYGMYFITGIVIGIVVMLIGGAMSAMKKEPEEEIEEELDEELEEELTELEEEIEEEGICPTCGAVIPIDAEECPECGEELEPPEEMEEEEEAEEEEEEIFEEQECPICGAEVPGDAEECPECGEPLGEEAEEDVFEDL